MLEETLAIIQSVHEGWIAELKALADGSENDDTFLQGLLDWQGKQANPDYLDGLGDAFALVELIGRGQIIDELENAAFMDPAIGTVRFTEAHDFLRQKVSLPSKVWTETLERAHDRAFVVAGADSVALVEDLRGALTRAIDGGGGLEAFRRDFDDIVLRNGWQYNGGRNWRTRVIYDTNLRTMHQAGRLKQMRHPDVIAARPYWRYVHAETRQPKQPRDQHLAWDGMVLRHDDPIWQRIYPPNGWKCSCGVHTVSASGLKRLGKDGPDTAPELKARRVTDPTTGEKISVPEGVDFGWSYQPGDTWERGLVPRELQKPLSLAAPELPLPVSPPLSDLGRAFTAPELQQGESPDFYVSRFLERFGATIGKGVMHRDKAGQAVLISDGLFRNGDGSWKVTKFGRERDIERLAEAIFDPDEIWVDWEEAPVVGRRLVRRYLRWDTETGGYSAFSWNARLWHGLTSFSPRKGRRQNKPDLRYLERHRRGALLYRRKN